MRASASRNLFKLNGKILDVCSKNVRDLKRLHRHNFPEQWDDFVYASLCDKLSTFGYIVYYEGKPVAEATLQWFLRDLKSNELGLYLATFSVLEEYRKLGIGTELLKFIFNDCEKTKHATAVYLHVKSKNKAAIRFYSNRGFVREGKKLDNFYWDTPDSDAFLMKRDNPFHTEPDEAIVAYLRRTGCDSSKLLYKFDDDDQWEVERIIDKRIKHRKIQYLVKWVGYEETNWEDAANLNCQNLIDEFYMRTKEEVKKRVNKVKKQAKIIGIEKEGDSFEVIVNSPDEGVIRVSPLTARLEYGNQYMEFLQAVIAV